MAGSDDEVRVATALLVVVCVASGGAAAALWPGTLVGPLLVGVAALAGVPALVVAVLSTAGQSVGEALRGGEWLAADVAEMVPVLVVLVGAAVIPLEAGTVSAARPVVPPVSGSLVGGGAAATTVVVLLRAAAARVRRRCGA